MTVDINIPNGIYYLRSVSSMGKSYLLSEYTDISNANRVYIDGITYSLYRDAYEDLEKIFSRSPKLVMVDRADLYIDADTVELLNEHKSECVILVSYKSLVRKLNLDAAGYATISYDTERFIVNR